MKFYIIFTDYPKLKNRQLSQQLKCIIDREITVFKVYHPGSYKESNKFYQTFETHSFDITPRS